MYQPLDGDFNQSIFEFNKQFDKSGNFQQLFQP